MGHTVSSASKPFVVGHRPTVTSALPPIAPRTGGLTALIEGEHLTGATAVFVGGQPAHDVAVLDDRHVRFTVPAGSSSAASIIVIARGITSHQSTAQLRYL